MASLELPFVCGELPGRVTVTCVANEDPVSLGKPESAKGFPVCEATVQFAGKGYRAFFGWVQMVRSTDDASSGAEFEMDPLELVSSTGVPFAFFGLRPTLFDAPSRTVRTPVSWTAHSFLTVVALPHRVVPIVGFRWGFHVDGRHSITLDEPNRLDISEWRFHLPLLRRSYPEWEFEADTPNSHWARDRLP